MEWNGIGVHPNAPKAPVAVAPEHVLHLFLVRSRWRRYDQFMNAESALFNKQEPDFSGITRDTLNEMQKNYFEPVTKLSSEDLASLQRIVKEYDDWDKKFTKWLKFKGDPDEIIYRNLTREMILGHFDKSETYNVEVIAACLNLNTVNTKRNIVPFLLREGYKVQ